MRGETGARIVGVSPRPSCQRGSASAGACLAILASVIEGIKTIARRTLPTSMYGPLRARRVRRFIASYEPRTVRHDYAGFALLVRLEDPLGEGWYDRDWDEPAEISQLRGGRLRTGAAVFDIGAHQGIVALILARIVGERGRVIAVEAEPHNVRVARNNVAANEIRNVTILHAAVGATNGTLSFIESLNGRVAPRGRPGAIDVPATTVDAIAVEYGHTDVVLIDVEGF
ncbi:MAG: FkbM family methyltransferase, partial [Solirubrobacteraceae bacterium]